MVSNQQSAIGNQQKTQESVPDRWLLIPDC
jgi:hypothetical protein